MMDLDDMFDDEEDIAQFSSVIRANRTLAAPDEIAALRKDAERDRCMAKQLLDLLREARDTIDAMPGYPKGAELCDRIDAIEARM